MIYVVDVLRSNDVNIYYQIRDYLESQESSILKTSSEIVKDLAFYESELLKYEINEEKIIDDSGKMTNLKESDFAKLEKYEILKKMNESLKLEIVHLKEQFPTEIKSQGKKGMHKKKDSLESQLEECVRYYLLLTANNFFYKVKKE